MKMLIQQKLMLGARLSDLLWDRIIVADVMYNMYNYNIQECMHE